MQAFKTGIVVQAQEMGTKKYLCEEKVDYGLYG